MSNPQFDCVVIGSGFGGATVAWRLAQAGREVCLLERGRAYPPGSFPRSPAGMRDNFWDPRRGIFGMYSVWSFKKIEALVSAGLGGGSLIYANVLLRKDRRWFTEWAEGRSSRPWPVQYEDLERHYYEVEQILKPVQIPVDPGSFPMLPKTAAMRDAAAGLKHLNLTWDRAPIAVTFADGDSPPAPGIPITGGEDNLHNRPRLTCRLCGECFVGCNDGSKNTLDFNLLTLARKHGADIRTLCEVKNILPSGEGGYEVEYADHAQAAGGNSPRHRITARRLILCAGTLGSTYLLLRNREHFPNLGKLGTRFCGNGDLLGLFLRSRDRATGAPRRLDPTWGPVITSYVRGDDALDGGSPDGRRGFYIEDGGYPAFVAWLVESSQLTNIFRRFAHFGWRRLKAMAGMNPESDITAEVRSLVGSAELSSGSLPVLGMGRDVPDGRMRLAGDRLAIDWTTKTSAQYFDRLRETMKALASEFGAQYRDNPTYRLRRVITVHPLGGCPMANSVEEGVVDPVGKVFGYDDLYIADGSVLPGPVGPNPALTIAALAHRTAERILAT